MVATAGVFSHSDRRDVSARTERCSDHKRLGDAPGLVKAQGSSYISRDSRQNARQRPARRHFRKLADHEEGRGAGAGSLCPRSLAQLTDIPFFFSVDEETSAATIQSESPGPRAPADGGPVLNRARACCVPDCRAADVAVVAFWLVCLAVFLVIAIVLGLTLGPNKARKVSRRYDDEGAGDDERVFREGAYVRCGLLALILAVFGLGVRLRRVAGAPTTRRLASRSIELTSHAS